MMTNAWSGRNPRSVTGRTSPAQISPAWWRRNVAQGWPASLGWARLPHVALDRARAQAHGELQPLAADPVGTPPPIRRGQLADPRDRLGGHLRLGG